MCFISEMKHWTALRLSLTPVKQKEVFPQFPFTLSLKETILNSKRAPPSSGHDETEPPEEELRKEEAAGIVAIIQQELLRLCLVRGAVATLE